MSLRQITLDITTTPLTTEFTRPSSCSTHWTFEPSSRNFVDNGLLIQNVLSDFPDSDCFPAGWNVYGRVNSVQVYSPGTCPHGYTTPFVLQNEGTTTAVCCESGFSYYTTAPADHVNGDVFTGCVSTFPAGSATTVPGIARTSNTNFLTTATPTGPIQMWALPYTVIYQSNDLKLFSPSPTASVPSATGTDASASQIDASSANPTSSSSSSGLSAGAAAGIAIAALVGALAIAALVGFLIIRRRERRDGYDGRLKSIYYHYSSKEPKPLELSAESQPTEINGGGRKSSPVELG